VGRRDRRGDDVGGVGRGACIAFVERAARGDLTIHQPRHGIPAPTSPIPIPEEADWWVAATGAAMTWVGSGAAPVLRSWSAPHGAIGLSTNPRHVIPAQAGTQPDEANPDPGGGGLVGRRDRRGDDVGGVRRGAARWVGWRRDMASVPPAIPGRDHPPICLRGKRQRLALNALNPLRRSVMFSKLRFIGHNRQREGTS